MGNVKMTINKHTRWITLPRNFFKITESKDKLINAVFSNISQNYKNHEWLIVRSILAAEINDINVINFCIQYTIPGETCCATDVVFYLY